MIYTLGEILLDIIIQDNNTTHAVAGGSVLNVSVTLVRKDVPVSIISETGDDKTSEFILNFLQENNINTSYITKYKNSKTPLALAFLDKEGKPSYTFYKSYPDKRILKKDMDFKSGDILLFASFYSVDTSIRPEVKKIITKAKKSGCLIMYDPNIRHSGHLQNPMVAENIIDNIKIADIIKGSDEDFLNIFGKGSTDFWFEKIKKINPAASIIITKGGKGSSALIENTVINTEAEKVDVKSTVGAGDAYSAGVISGIVKSSKEYKSFDINDWKKIIKEATEISAEVCGLNQNYINNPG